MTDAHKIILSPIDFIGGEHVPSATRTVADCGHECWIAPETLRHVNNPLIRTTTTCMGCLHPSELGAILRGQRELFAAPGVRESLNDYLGVGAVDQLWARFNVRERDPESPET